MNQHRLIVILGVLLSVTLVGAGRAVAQDRDLLYRVDGIEVAETADNSVTARTNAMEQGKRNGLIRLLERLTAPADRARLPSFEGVPVDRYIQSFDVVDERVSGTSYEAELSVSYLAEPVQGLLRGIGIPFAIRRSTPVLIIPAMRGENGLELWQQTDSWTLAWYETAEGPGLMNLLLPLGDVEDVSTLTSEDLAAGRTAGAEALARRYGANSVVLAIATVPEDRGLDTGSDTGPERPDRLRAEAVRLDAQPEAILAETIMADPNDEDADLFAEGTELVVLRLEDLWKQDNIVRLDVVDSLEVDVPLQSLTDWITVKEALEATQEVRAYNVRTLSRSGASLALDYVGGEAQLQSSLERRGLTLTADAGGMVLHPLGRAPRSGTSAVPGLQPATPTIEQSPLPNSAIPDANPPLFESEGAPAG